MKTYPATLADMRLFAEMAAQLDDVKRMLPAESEAVRLCAVLQTRGHEAVSRLLGVDDHLVYGPSEPEEELTV